jgi:hypothetical protein
LQINGFPVHWDNESHKQKGIKKMKYSKEQVRFLANVILTSCLDRVESHLPDTISLQEYEKNKVDIAHCIGCITDTACMSLAIFFAQTTGIGMGCYDWSGASEFCQMVQDLVKIQTDKDSQDCKSFQNQWLSNPTRPANCTILFSGVPCFEEPICNIAEKFADEWFSCTLGK